MEELVMTQCPYLTPKQDGKKSLGIWPNFEQSELKGCVGSPEINETSVKISAPTTLRAL